MDPFIMVDHYTMTEPTFGAHPHAGLSAVTVLFEDTEGKFNNRDSLGNDFDINPGDLYWLNAGSGAIHDEAPRKGASIHGLQIFVNLPGRMKHQAPSSLHVKREDMPTLKGQGYRVRLVLGRSNGVETDAASLANAEIDYVDINDFDLPIYNIDLEEQYGIPKCAHAFQARIEDADVILVSFAEHNGNFTVAFKNLFDWMSRIGRNVYRDKPIVMLATSPGPGGGNTVLKLAETAAPFFNGKVVGSLSIPSFFDNFDVDRGELTNGDLVEKLEQINDCDYCLAAHDYLGRNVAKLSSAEIEAARRGHSGDEKAAVAVEFAAKITKERGNVSSDDVQMVRSAGYSDAELVEIIGNVALNVLTNYINRVLATDIDFPSVQPLSE
eukprot:g5212.t1